MRALMRIGVASTLVASLVAASIGHAQAPESGVPTPPVTTAPAPPPAADPNVPAPPSNYAVPPPPPPAARYPAAPNLAPQPTPDLSPEVEPSTQLRIPAHIATRLRVLSTDLNTLAARGGGGIADGVFSIVTGGVLVTLGVVFYRTSGMSFMAPSMLVFGGASVGRGLIDLIVMPNPYDTMLDFSHMPMTTVAQVKDRLRYGESALEELSDRNRLARLLDSAVSLGAGATLIGLTLSARNNDNPDMDASNDTAFLVIGIIGASTLAIGGVISLLSPSDAERRWEAYQGLRDRLALERAAERQRRIPPASTTLSFVPVITDRTAGGVFSLRF